MNRSKWVGTPTRLPISFPVLKGLMLPPKGRVSREEQQVLLSRAVVGSLLEEIDTGGPVWDVRERVDGKYMKKIPFATAEVTGRWPEKDRGFLGRVDEI